MRYMIRDRWFPTHEIVGELLGRGIDFIGPYKKYAPIWRAIGTYIKKGGSYIVHYVIYGALAKYYKQSGVDVWFIFTNRYGHRLHEIRRDYLSGAKPLKESVQEIMVILTTVAHLRRKKRRQGWAVQICQVYDRRWQIETGFRDLNRITPSSNAWTNTRKLFMCSAGYWVYNVWHLERVKRGNCETARRYGGGVLRYDVLPILRSNWK